MGLSRTRRPGGTRPARCHGSALTFDPDNQLTAYGTILTAGYTGDGLRAWKQTSAGRTYFL